MLMFFHKGFLYRCPKIKIVKVRSDKEDCQSGDYGLGESWIEEGPSLDDIEAMMRYIQEQFPRGWRIHRGAVISACD